MNGVQAEDVHVDADAYFLHTYICMDFAFKRKT